MTAPLFKTKNLHLQTEFPQETEKWLRSLYGAAEDESLLCGVWTNPMLRKGFLITDKALRWYATNNDERIHGALLKEVNPNADFAICSALNAETATAIGAKTLAEELSRLEIAADGHIYPFFVQGLTEEKGNSLCNILQFAYMQGELPQTDLSTFVKPMSLLAFRNFCDGRLNQISSLADKILGITKTKKTAEANSDKSAAETNIANVEDTASQQDAATAQDKTAEANALPQTEAIESEKAQSHSKSFGNKLRVAALSLLDVCASLVFVATILIAIKPELLPFAANDDEPTRFVYLGTVGNYILKVNVVKNVSGSLAMWRNIFVSIGFICYIIFKSIVFLCSKNSGRKIVSALLLAITLLACFLMTSKFLLFIAFCFLIYLAFEFSCGFHAKGIAVKLIILFIVSTSGYILFGLLTNTQASESYRIIMENLAVIKDSLSLSNHIIWW